MDLNEILSEALDTQQPVETETTEAPTETQAPETEVAEEPTADAPAKPATAPKVDPVRRLEELSSDEAFATPDGRAAFLEAARELRTNLARWNTKLTKVDRKQATRREEIQQDRQLNAATISQLRADAATLKSGNAADIMGALGRITGQDPRKLYEEMTLQMATGRTEDPRLVEMQRRIDEQERRERAREESAREQAERRAEADCLTLASNEASYPHLSGFAKTNPDGVKRAFRETLMEMTQRGNPPSSFQDIADEIEAGLVSTLGQQQAVRKTGAAPAAKSESGDRPTRPRTVQPSMSQQPATRRPATQEERWDALKNDSDFLRQLGIS